jgi:hypothetical protein
MCAGGVRNKEGERGREPLVSNSEKNELGGETEGGLRERAREREREREDEERSLDTKGGGRTQDGLLKRPHRFECERWT